MSLVFVRGVWEKKETHILFAQMRILLIYSAYIYAWKNVPQGNNGQCVFLALMLCLQENHFVCPVVQFLCLNVKRFYKG
jgi:hypothetical protein